MIYKTVPVGVVIARIFRDFNLEDSHWIKDAIEWAGEAIEHIGAYNQLEKKDAVLEVLDHKVAIPTDLFTLEQVFYSLEEDVDEDNFKDKFKFPLPRSADKGSRAVYHNISASDEIIYQHSYIINVNYINTTFQEGIIGLSYTGIALDENGYPTIPDLISYKEAISWYIINRMILGGYKHIDPSINFVTTRDLWLQYCRQARSEAVMPDLDGFEHFSKNWVRLVTRRDRAFNSYSEQYLTVLNNAPYGSDHIDLVIP